MSKINVVDSLDSHMHAKTGRTLLISAWEQCWLDRASLR